MINCKICGKWQNVNAVMRNDLCQECRIKHDEMSGEDMSRMDVIGQNGPTGAHYKIVGDIERILKEENMWSVNIEKDGLPDNFNPRPKYYDLPTTGRLEDLIKDMTHFRGAAFKYMLRAGKKDPATEVEDIKKAIECLQIELGRFE